MTATPLAEAYEKLKELRRQGDSSGYSILSVLQDAQPQLLAEARRVSDELARTVADLVRIFEIKMVAERAQPRLLPLVSDELTRTVEGLVRIIEIKTVAERVFGNPTKAHAWLNRPNPSLSGQRPLDLLKDELGAAVVREMLERIDHGIFA